MPKYTLEFNLPEERPEYNNAVHGVDAFIFIHEFEEFLRREYKHTDIPETMTAEQMWEKVRDKWFELKSDHLSLSLE